MDLEEVPYRSSQHGLYVLSADIRTSQPLTQSWKGKSTKTRRRRSVSRPKSLGLWFTRKKDGSNANLTEEPEQEPADKESSRFSWKKSSRRGSILESAHPEAAKIDNHATPRPSARRSFTMRPEATQHLGPVKVHSESTVTCRINPPPPTRSQTTPAIEIVSPEIHSSEGRPFQQSKYATPKPHVHSGYNASTSMASECLQRARFHYQRTS